MRIFVGSNRVLPIVVLSALAAAVLLTPIAQRGISGAEATFCLGFLLIFAFFVASILKGLKLPEISGYIIAGVLCGPFVLNILSTEVVHSLQIFDDVALAIIALIAGGEMRLSFLKRKKSSIIGVIVGQVLFSFVGAMLVVVVLRDQLPFMSQYGTAGIIAAGLVFGVVTAARSPSTTIGVITEARAAGPFTNLIIGVTVILDVVVLVVVALIIPAARTLTVPGESFSLLFAKDLFTELGGTVVMGLVFGGVVGAYIRWLGEQLPIFLVGIGFVGSMICRHFHFEPLLAFMIAGFLVENFTVLGDSLIRGLERSALPVYVIFFAISGASIDLAALRATWVIALVLVVMRAAVFCLGTVAAAGVVRELKPFANNLWLGLLSQAGVTIGIATVIERRFEWGSSMKTVILAVVALNQLIGPIALKFVLDRRGEVGGMDRK